MSTENFSDEDMAVVGRAFMEAISNCAPKDWRPMECPSEIVGDLVNDLEELRSQHRELYFSAYALMDSVCEDHPAISGVFNASAHLRVCDALSKLDSQYGVTSPEVRVSMDKSRLQNKMSR